MAITGGAKVSDKLTCDTPCCSAWPSLLIGGGWLSPSSQRTGPGQSDHP
ncbi:MAG: hypothetical protein IPF42_19900 [Candidatus Microthrix sp.]|nr:hypothetical protein [Candidatus Microthrix sp.]